MKTLILIIALTAGFISYAHAEEDQPIVAVSPEWQLRPETPTLNLKLPPEEYQANDYERQREFDRMRECEFCRQQDQSAHGDSLVDKALGNRLRANAISNERDATDGFDSVTRNDGTRFVERRNPCSGIYTPDSDDDNKPGVRVSGKRLKGGGLLTVTIRH